MPRRLRFSMRSVERNKQKAAIKEATANRFSSLAVPASDDVETLNTYICDALRAGVTSVLSVRAKPVEHLRVRQARDAFHIAQRQLQSVVSREAAICRSEGRFAFLSQKNSRSKALVDAQRKLESIVAKDRARQAEGDKVMAKERYWEILEAGARAGAKDESPMAKVLEFQTNEFMVVTSRDLEVNKKNICLYYEKMYRIRDNMGAACEAEIDSSLAYISVVNEETVHACVAEGKPLSPLSPAAQSAADACSPMAKSDHRRGVQRNLDALVASHRIERAALRDRGDLIEQLHPGPSARLQRPFDEREVASVFSQLDDVGTGLDGLPAAALNAQVEGAIVFQTTRLLNKVHESGCIPDDWYLNRVVLVHKKGGDVHNLTSYRGIGVGALLLKVLGLLMLERLDEFVTATKGLSPFQFGFRRQVGTADAVLTVSEVVRCAIKQNNRHVSILLVDLKAAYDTVIRSILFSKCAKKGITGRFLAILIALYAHAVTIIDMCGDLSIPIEMECGLIQGSVLSPILFNLVANDTVEAVARVRAGHDLVGIPCPRVYERGCTMFEYEQAGLPQPVDQADYMASAWFADDGAIFESRIPVLQQMVDCLALEFNRIGLLFNVPKTKWLVVAPAAVSGLDEADHILPSAYLALQAQLRQTPLRVGGEVIEMVSHFRYLGVKVSWRWDFASAWREATKSARAEVLRMIRSGIHNWGVSMDALLDFIRGKVSCHFNYLAAIAGGGGLPSAAHWAKADDVMTLALRVVLGYRFADGDSLKAETGTWPIQVRTKMLMLRFYCKILTLDRSAPLYRAMVLSLRSTTSQQFAAPATQDAAPGRCHLQTWMQHVAAALVDFGLPRLTPQSGLWHGLWSLQVDRNDGLGFVPLALPGSVAAPPVPDGVLLRLVSSDIGTQPYEEGVNCWSVPEGELLPRSRRVIKSDAAAPVVPLGVGVVSSRYDKLSCVWSEVVRLACFVSLKRRAKSVSSKSRVCSGARDCVRVGCGQSTTWDECAEVVACVVIVRVVRAAVPALVGC
jgi:hypothetical protein